MKKVAIISFTQQGNQLGKRLQGLLTDDYLVDRYILKKYAQEYSGCNEEVFFFEKGNTLLGEIFEAYDFFVVIGACGIAVRLLDGLMKGKEKDAGVVVMDVTGRYAIPLLSGHLGGANAFAEHLARLTGAVPVITTATDCCDCFSPDLFAKQNHLRITSLSCAKQVAAAVLEYEKVGLISELPVMGLPEGFYRAREEQTDLPEDIRVWLYIGYRMKPVGLEELERKNRHMVILQLIPQDIVIGTGCKKNTDCNLFRTELLAYLKRQEIDVRRVRALHSISLKQNEEAILSFIREFGIEGNFYEPEELRQVQGEFNTSDFVKEITGVDNVCERSAVMTGGKLIVRKQAGNGVTFAAARLPMTVRFSW